MSKDVVTSEESGEEQSRAESATDRVTMAEAARLKGVSYHTVSRAVRRGKLPVLRLGRMALISMADLQAWQPMKERAPRKYRRKQPSAPGRDPLSLIDVEHIELVRRVATFYELIGTIANEGSLEELAEVVTTRFAEVLHLERASLWQFDLDAEVARRLAMYHERILSLPDEMAIDRAGILKIFAGKSQPVIVESLENELQALSPDDLPPVDIGPVIVAPMTYQGRQIGVILGDCTGKPLEYTDESLELAEVIATQVAIALDNVMRRDMESRRRLHLESIIDDLNGAVSAVDHRGRVTYFNDAELEMFDLRQDEDVWLGQQMTDFASRKRRLSLSGQPISVDDNPMVRALRGERLHDARQIVVRKNGEQRHVSTSSRPVFVDGDLAGAVTVTRDLTAERAAEQRDQRYMEQLEHALRRSQMIADIVVEINETRSSLDLDVMSQFAIDRVASEFNADAGILWVLDSDHLFHLAAAYNAAGVDLPEQGFEPDGFILANDALTKNMPALVDINAFEEGELVVDAWHDMTHMLIIPLRIRGQRSGVAYLGFRELPILDQSDEIFASVWGRQCAQAIDSALLFKQIESAHGRLVAVIDQLPQAVVIVDGEYGTISVANQAADELWGVHLEEGGDVQGLPLLNNDNERLEGDEHPLVKVSRTGEQVVSELLIVPQPDGTLVEVIANHAPIMDLRGSVLGAVSALQRRSDFKSLDRVKDEFISVVAHELRNPLTSLRGNLQLLHRRVRKREDDEAQADLQRVDIAIQQVDRVADLVSRMLDVSRSDLGNLDVSPEETDAALLVREAVNEAIGMDPVREFRLEVPDSMPAVWDAGRILQVLSNLMQNAARYAPGTLVEISLAEVDGDRIRIRVRDHGPGVPATIRRRLFKQYYRFDDGEDDGHHSAADGSRGLGIGLYISARLARAHHGSLRVRNARDGGAIFTLELPRDASQQDDAHE